MTNQIFELSDADLDGVIGATSYQEALANMAKWNAAITTAGEFGSLLHHGSKGNGGSCPGQYKS